jgi:LacI family transcriptional regulator
MNSSPAKEAVCRPSLADIASACGVSTMTVSRALRNHPKVAEATRRKVLAAAEKAGYRMDPRIGQLMQHLRAVRARPSTEPLALVWPDVTPQQREASPFLSRITEGVRSRAETLGFSFSEYYAKESGMTAARLDRILYSRGVRCLVFGQVIHRGHAHLRMRWERYCVATIGLGLWKPGFHRVHFHHYDGMMQAMRWLRHHGHQRIALFLNRTTNEAMLRAWEAAFLAFHPLGLAKAADLMMLFHPKQTHLEANAWLRKVRPDVLLSEGRDASTYRLNLPAGTRFFSTHRPPDDQAPAGLDQRDQRLGEAAVDLVSAHFARNELGVPAEPKVLMVCGKIVGDTPSL